MSGWEAVWARRGIVSTLLLPLAWAYGAVTALHRTLYRTRWIAPQRVGVPVVVVGNLVAGGAGKTPTVIALVDALRARGYTPGVVSRGYGARASHAALPRPVSRDNRAQDVGDEPLLIHLRTGAPVAVGADRVAAAHALLATAPATDVILSDDGLQHLRLARDVQVLVFDERGAGNGRLLPAGPLRQAVPARVPTDTHVLYNAATASLSLPGYRTQRRLKGAVDLAGWWRGEPAREILLSALRGRPVLAVAGLARPARFFAMLREAGLDARALALPDHHDYATLPWPAGTLDVVLTEKDAVKLPVERVGATRVWVVTLDSSFEPGFVDAVVASLPALRPGAPSPPSGR